MKDLLIVLLECGSMDLEILDNVGYNLGEIAEKLIIKGIKPTLNTITDMIFQKGQSELKDAVWDAIRHREALQRANVSVGEDEYKRFQKEIDELKSVNPEKDMCWLCNYIDTSCWFCYNEEIYRKYIPEAIGNIERNMGFTF